jgi:hypothetical protein
MRAVAVIVGNLGTVVAAVPLPVLVLLGLAAVADPESCEQTGTHSDEQPDEPLRDRANPPEREATRTVWTLDVLHDIAHDVDDLCRR